MTFHKARRITLWTLIIVIGLAIYCNIGWALGTYAIVHSNNPTGTLFETLLFGPQHVTTVNTAAPTAAVISFMLLWPIIVLFIIAVWFFYGLYALAWFIFAGGIAKALGIG